MSKKVVQNTFNKGLIMDLNPINTPKTVLTDCVNGTILTYDGNEYLLQNDKGNFKLKGCKLDKNYIPIGIKEHADILYIASYNPITKKTQLGSYPSPSYGERDSEKAFDDPPELKSIFDGVDYEGVTIMSHENCKVYKYSDLIKNENTIAFVGKDENEFKLNPGDYYKFECDPSVLNKLETLDYYIMSDNKSLYNINDSIKLNENTEKPIDWDVPGWLVLKQSLLSISNFQICVNSDITYEYENNANAFVITPTFRLKSNDEHVLKLWSKQNHNNLQFYLHIDVSIDGQSQYSSFLYMSYDSLEPNGTLIVWTYWTKYVSIAEDQTVVFTAIPYLLDTSTGKAICFDNNVNTFSFSPSDSDFNTDVHIGDSLWQYEIDNDKLYVEFDTKNVAILSKAYLYYTVYTVDKDPVYSGNTILQNIKISDWSKTGTTTYTIDFDNSETRLDNRHYFDKENIYIIEFNVCSSEQFDENTILTGPLYKMVIVSSISNNLSDDRFDQIKLTDWLESYKNSIIDKSLNCDVTITSEASPVIEDPDDNYNRWVAGYDHEYEDLSQDGGATVKKYSRFTECDNPELFNSMEYRVKKDVAFDLQYKANSKLLTGEMWNGFTPTIIYKNSSDQKIFQENFENGELSGNIQQRVFEANGSISWNLDRLTDASAKICTYEKYDCRDLMNYVSIFVTVLNNGVKLQAYHISDTRSLLYEAIYDYNRGLASMDPEDNASDNCAINGKTFSNGWYSNDWKDNDDLHCFYNLDFILSDFVSYVMMEMDVWDIGIITIIMDISGSQTGFFTTVSDDTDTNNPDRNIYLKYPGMPAGQQKTTYLVVPKRNLDQYFDASWITNFKDTFHENGLLFIPFEDNPSGTPESIQDYIDNLQDKLRKYTAFLNDSSGGYFMPKDLNRIENFTISEAITGYVTCDQMIYNGLDLFKISDRNSFLQQLSSTFSGICTDTFDIDNNIVFEFNTDSGFDDATVGSEMKTWLDNSEIKVNNLCNSITYQSNNFKNDYIIKNIGNTMVYYVSNPCATNLSQNEQEFYKQLNSEFTYVSDPSNKFLLMHSGYDTTHQTVFYLGLVNDVTIPYNE